MNIRLTKEAEKEYQKLIKSGKKNSLKRIVQIFSELEVNPRVGIGSPERLKHFNDREVWSRQIDKKNRIVYLIQDDELIVLVISVLGHYSDK